MIQVFNHGIGVQDEWPQYKHVYVHHCVRSRSILWLICCGCGCPHDVPLLAVLVDCHHRCWYELGFCHMFMLQWEKAREKFAALEKENDSFQVFYTYQQAVSGAAVQSCPSVRAMRQQ